MGAIVSANYYNALITGGVVQYVPPVPTDPTETPEEPRPVADATVFGLGLRDTQALLLANEKGVTAIPDKNADLTALLSLVSQIAASASKIALSTAVVGDPINEVESAKMLELQAQLDAFLLS